MSDKYDEIARDPSDLAKERREELMTTCQSCVDDWHEDCSGITRSGRSVCWCWCCYAKDYRARSKP